MRKVCLHRRIIVSVPRSTGCSGLAMASCRHNTMPAMNGRRGWRSSDPQGVSLDAVGLKTDLRAGSYRPNCDLPLAKLLGRDGVQRRDFYGGVRFAIAAGH